MVDPYEREHPLIPVLFDPFTSRPDMMQQSYKGRINFELIAAEYGPYPVFLAQVIMKAKAWSRRREEKQREKDVKAADELLKHPTLCDDVIGIIKSFLANPN